MICKKVLSQKNKQRKKLYIPTEAGVQLWLASRKPKHFFYFFYFSRNDLLLILRIIKRKEDNKSSKSIARKRKATEVTN